MQVRKEQKGLYTDFVYCCDEALHSRIFFSSCEEVIESRRCDDARHDALVIAEEHKSYVEINGAKNGEKRTQVICLPVVATVETAKERGLPVRPMNFGGAIAGTVMLLESLWFKYFKIYRIHLPYAERKPNERGNSRQNENPNHLLNKQTSLTGTVSIKNPHVPRPIKQS